MKAIPIEYARVIETIDAPIDAVWGIVAGFGALRPWVAGIELCRLEGFGVGAIRTVSAMGAVTRERLISCDPENHRLRYELIDPTILPATGIASQIELVALGDQSTEFRWTSEARQIDEGAKSALTEMIEGFYRASIESLKALLQ